MNLKRIFDQDEVKKILFHPDIKSDISGGIEYSYNDTDLPMDSVLYIGGYDNCLFAVSCFHRFRGGIKIHINILKSHRLKYARDFVKQCLSMVKCNTYIEFPEKRKDIFNLATKFGFDSIANNNSHSNKVLMRLLWDS